MFPVFYEKIWGINLSNGRLTGVEVKQKLKGYAWHKIADIPDFAEQTVSELKSRYTVEQPHPDTVVLSLPLSMVMLRTIPYDGDIFEIKSAIAEQMESLFPFKGEELYFDVYPLNVVETREMIIAAVIKNDIDDLIYRLAGINLKPNQIIIEPLALTCMPIKESGRMMLIGCHEDKIWCTTFLPGHLENAVFMSGMEELKEHTGEVLPDHVWLKGVPEQEFESVLAPGIPRENIHLSDPVNEAMGAGLWPLNRVGPSFDLLGHGAVKNRQFFLAKVLTILIAGLLVFLIYLDINVREGAVAEINKSISDISNKVETVIDMQQEISGLRDQIDLINGLNERHVTRLHILKELSRLLPQNAWLRELLVMEDHFEISGEAGVASDIISILENSSLIDQVRLKAPVVKSETGAELFRIEGRIVKE